MGNRKKTSSLDIGPYKNSETYTNADANTRKLIDQYIAKERLSSEDAALLLKIEDLRRIPREVKQKGNRSAESICIGAMAIELLGYYQQNRRIMIVGSIVVIMASILYFSGVLNPYSATLSKCKKTFKKRCPDAEPFKQYCLENGISLYEKPKGKE